MQSREKEEKRQHSTAAIPYSFYECRIPECFMNVPMHWHKEFEINCILQGEGEFICGDDRFVAKEGSLLILPPNMLHAAYPCQNQALVYHALVFHPIMLGVNSNDRSTTECIRPIINGSMKINIPITPETDGYFELKGSVDRIFSYVRGNRPQLDLLMKSELLRLFWLMENNSKLISRKDAGISYSGLVRPALEFMMDNFQENISISQLAALSNLSKSYFMGCFKKAVGVGAIEHLTQLRVNAACEALTDTDKTISDVALDCGYSNLSNFNRQFKKITGSTPNEYRRNIKSVR